MIITQNLVNIFKHPRSIVHSCMSLIYTLINYKFEVGETRVNVFMFYFSNVLV